MAEASSSSPGTTKETVTAPESKRLMLFQTCLDSLNKKLAEEYKECFKQLYGPVFESHPPYVDKIYDAFTKAFNADISRRMQRFREEHNVAQKLKELEEISENPEYACEGADKAWRPTGLSAVQQQEAVDIQVKVKMMDKLQKELDKEESELQELMEKASKYREEGATMKEKLDQAEKKREILEVDLIKNLELLRSN